MSAPTVRSDYDSLNEIARNFSQQADATRKSLQQLQSRMDDLQKGGWIGKGATAYYREMGSEVLPAVKRLQAALEAGAKSTQQISRIMKNAEDEAARVLSGAGAGAAAGAFGAAVAGAVGAAVAGAVGAAVGSAAGGAAGGAAGAAAGAAAGGAGGAAGAAGGREARVQALIDNGDYNGAIDEAVKSYGIDISAVKGNPRFDATVSGEGSTSPDRTVGIGSEAYSSPGWLASSIGHEAVHARQAADRWYTDAQGTAINEIEAYDWEIANAGRNGLSTDEVAELHSRRDNYYNDLTAANKKLVDKGIYVLPKKK